MTVSELKQKIREADWKQVTKWLLLVDTLDNYHHLRRYGTPQQKRGLPSFSGRPSLGWKVRHARRGVVLASIAKIHHLFDFQVEEARELLVHYAGQIREFEGKVQIRDKEVSFDESTKKWKTVNP